MRAFALVAIAVLCAASARGAQARTPAATVLVDQRGTPFTLQSLRGRPVVVTFVATRCTDACPIADAIFARLANERIGAQLVTITLDAAYDTPFVMSRFARALGARAPRWRVASGPPRAVDALLAAFGVTRAAHDVHSTFVYGLDERGRMSGIFPLSSQSANAIQAWLRERPRSSQPVAQIER